MPEEPTNEEVVETKDIIEDVEKAEMNKKIAAVTGSFFRALATITDEEIYELAYTDAGKESPRLLEVVNVAYEAMLTAGGELPCGHFDHYKKLVSDFNNTLVFNVDAKLEANRETVIAKAIGKTEEPERISHKDIIDALTDKG